MWHTSHYFAKKDAAMSLVMNAIIISFGMILLFFLFFAVLFLVAITLSPIEKSLSKMIWDATTPPSTKVPVKGSFKDFSKKHER